MFSPAFVLGAGFLFALLVLLITFIKLTIPSIALPVIDPSNAILNVASDSVSSGSAFKYAVTGFASFGFDSIKFDNRCSKGEKANLSATAPLATISAALPVFDIGVIIFNLEKGTINPATSLTKLPPK